MKFLVLGCNGMAGHVISIYLQEQGYNVVGLAKSRSNYIKTVVGDTKDLNFLKSVIYNGNFDIVINCIGILTKSSEEKKAEAVYINGFLPHFLAEVTKELDTRIIQMSTDCVFSGNRGGYCEYDLRDGASFYDRTKAIGELEDEKNMTIRSSIVGPDINKDGVGLLNWFMQQSQIVDGYTNVFWSGQTTLQYAKTIEAIVPEKVYGIFNMVPDESISKNDLLVLFNKYLRKDKVVIRPKNDIVCDKSLKRTRKDFDIPIPDYEKMIVELLEWMRVHRRLYPHYHLD